MLNQIYKEMEVQDFIFCALQLKKGVKLPAINTLLFKHLTMIRTSMFWLDLNDINIIEFA